ncbi:MAG: A/G-specific adenine glycosylase [Pseudomonadota bacterium]|nr:A/G-specific adenine glycosylase [Pseudomonadota bacterium]
MTRVPGIADFGTRLLDWFAEYGRHHLPWQHPRTPYRVWLSEIMLQQTQVAVAAPYFERFVAALPDLPALAAASQDHVLALWSGLGYYARARNLQATAKICVDIHGGDLPRNADALHALPGIGRSTAGAIMTQAWGERAAILDANVKRVLCRLHGIEGWPGTPAVEKQLWAIAESLLPDTRLSDYTQALMDFGATLCTRVDPSCLRCPLQNDCIALREGRIAELPSPKPGKPLPQRTVHMLVIEDDAGRILLQRRPPTGVWACLWSLPEHADPSEAHAWLVRHVKDEVESLRAGDPVMHVFSHYKLLILPHCISGARSRTAIGDNPDLRWTHRTELAGIGLPAPIRRLLKE